MAGFDALAIARMLGYAELRDLVLHLPLRYLDETRITPLAAARPGETAQVEGVIAHAEVQAHPRRQLVLHVASVEAGAARLFVRLLHFYPSQVAQLRVGARVRLLGEVRPGLFCGEMVHPQVRVVNEATPLPDSLTPVYPAIAALSPNAIRKAVDIALSGADLSDSLPAEWLQARGLPTFGAAVRALHRPPPDADQTALQARASAEWRRIKFDELLAQQLTLRLAARQRRALRAPPLVGDGGLAARLLAGLPFSLTPAQARARDEILRDLARARPMNRLLQGDVGSGKTLVAALALLPALAAGHQAAVMAPTEILAEQHHRKFAEWLAPLGLKVAWLAGALPARERRAGVAAVAAGEIQDHRFKQAATSVGQGVAAAMEVEKYLADLEDRAYPGRK